MSVGSVHSQIRPPDRTAQHGTARRSRSTTPAPSSSSTSHAPVPPAARGPGGCAAPVSSTNSASGWAASSAGAGPSLRRHTSNVLSAQSLGPRRTRLGSDPSARTARPACATARRGAARDVSYRLPVSSFRSPPCRGKGRVNQTAHTIRTTASFGRLRAADVTAAIDAARAEAERLHGALAKSPFLVTDNGSSFPSHGRFADTSTATTRMCASATGRRPSSGCSSASIGR